MIVNTMSVSTLETDQMPPLAPIATPMHADQQPLLRAVGSRQNVHLDVIEDVRFRVFAVKATEDVPDLERAMQTLQRVPTK
jgi:hypothetical protein